MRVLARSELSVEKIGRIALSPNPGYSSPQALSIYNRDGV